MPAVFISHSSKDQQVARTVCAALENRGLGCWIASRDVSPGENYQEAIVRAIRAAKVMVLVFSDNANNSGEIKKELSLASRYNLVVIPARVEDVVPSEAFELEFATRQWVNLFEDWEREIERLSRHIGGAVGIVPGAPSAGAPSIVTPVPPAARERASSPADVRPAVEELRPAPPVELQPTAAPPRAEAAPAEPSRIAPLEIPSQKVEPVAAAPIAAKRAPEASAPIDASRVAATAHRPALNILAIVVGLALGVQGVFQLIVARGDWLVRAVLGNRSYYQPESWAVLGTVLLCALSLALAVGTVAIGAKWRPTQPWVRPAALAVCVIALVADLVVALVGWNYGSPFGGSRDLRFTVFALPGVFLSAAAFFYWYRIRPIAAPLID